MTDTTKTTIADVVREARENAPRWSYLASVGQGERPWTYLLHAIIRGDRYVADVEIDEAFGDSRADAAEQWAREAYDDALQVMIERGDIDSDSDLLNPSADDLAPLIQDAFDLDESDPLKELAWGQEFVRVQLGARDESVFIPGDADADAVIAALGLEDLASPGFRDAVVEIVREARLGDHFKAYLFGSVHLEDMLATLDDSTVTLSGGALLLETEGGGGLEVELPRDFTVTIPRQHVTHDDEQDGYAWDDAYEFAVGSYRIECG